MVVPVDVASVVACWCIPVEVYREEKQTGMPSYRLRGCQTNQGAQDGNHIYPNYPQPLDRPPAGPLKSSGLLGHQAQPELAPAGTTYMNQSKTMNQHCQHWFDRWWNWRKHWNYGCCFNAFQVHVWNSYERYNKCRLVPYSPTTHAQWHTKSKTLLTRPVNRNLCFTRTQVYNMRICIRPTSAFAFASVYAANSSSSLLTSSCAVWNVLDGHPALTPWWM